MVEKEHYVILTALARTGFAFRGRDLACRLQPGIQDPESPTREATTPTPWGRACRTLALSSGAQQRRRKALGRSSMSSMRAGNVQQLHSICNSSQRARSKDLGAKARGYGAEGAFKHVIGGRLGDRATRI